MVKQHCIIVFTNSLKNHVGFGCSVVNMETCNEHVNIPAARNANSRMLLVWSEEKSLVKKRGHPAVFYLTTKDYHHLSENLQQRKIQLQVFQQDITWLDSTCVYSPRSSVCQQSSQNFLLSNMFDVSDQFRHHIIPSADLPDVKASYNSCEPTACYSKCIDYAL